jgi:hypothetical protein
MKPKRSTQLTRQIGEHLVASRLGRMGYIAAPFAGKSRGQPIALAIHHHLFLLPKEMATFQANAKFRCCGI